MNKSRVYYSAMFFQSAVMTMLGLILGLWVLDFVLRSIVVVLFMTGIGVVFLLIPVILPVWRAARRFEAFERRVMTRGEGWLFALIFALLTGLALVLLVAGFGMLGAPLAVRALEIAGEDAVFTASSITVYSFVLVTVNRFLLWLSAQFNKRPT